MLSDKQEAIDAFQLPTRVRDNIKGFAGPFSTWLLHIPARILFDAGEGVTSCLRNRVFLPEALFLTHAHLDHIAGLTSLLMARTTMRGDKKKPLTIYFPAGAAEEFRMIQRHLDDLIVGDVVRASWKGLEPGERVQARKLTVEAFETIHGVCSLGFRLLETRNRLKPEFQSLAPAELSALRQAGREIREEFEHVTFAITGDTGPGLAPNLFHEADVLFHESTFLDADDRVGQHHATMAEAFQVAVEANVRQLVLYHFSQRYTATEIFDAAERIRQEIGFKGGLSCVTGFTEEPEFY